jgi:hypothetical protein
MLEVGTPQLLAAAWTPWRRHQEFVGFDVQHAGKFDEDFRAWPRNAPFNAGHVAAVDGCLIRQGFLRDALGSTGYPYVARDHLSEIQLLHGGHKGQADASDHILKDLTWCLKH